MAACPSCQHEVGVLFYSFRSPFFRNMFRSPANRIYACNNCGAELTMTIASFILCQVIFIILIVPCAIVFARLNTWLLASSQAIHQLSLDFPAMAMVCLWILPTLIVTLLIFNQFAKRFVEFQKSF